MVDISWNDPASAVAVSEFSNVGGESLLAADAVAKFVVKRDGRPATGSEPLERSADAVAGHHRFGRVVNDGVPNDVEIAVKRLRMLSQTRLNHVAAGFGVQLGNNREFSPAGDEFLAVVTVKQAVAVVRAVPSRSRATQVCEDVFGLADRVGFRGGLDKDVDERVHC